MKKIFFIAAIILTVSAQAQIKPTYPISVNIGSNGYVTINGQDYIRPEIGFFYNYADSFKTESGTYDSTVTIFWQRDGSFIYSHVLDTMFVYGDSTNKQARNMTILRTWFKTNAYYRGN